MHIKTVDAKLVNDEIRSSPNVIPLANLFFGSLLVLMKLSLPYTAYLDCGDSSEIDLACPRMFRL